MNSIIKIFLTLIAIFLGFAAGRLGDKYGGHLNAPHHWIWGLALIILGIIFRNSRWGIFMTAFGLGHFISDLDDFLHLRIWGVDAPHKWKFWSIK